MAFYLLAVTRRLKQRGCKIVITVHNPIPHESLGLLSAPEMRWFALADAVIVHDARGRDALLERGVVAARIHEIPHGVALSGTLDAYSPTSGGPGRKGEKTSRRYVVMFGNLRGYKGVGVLLKAWREVCKSLDDVELVIAGRLWDGGSSPMASLAARILGTRKDAHAIRLQLADPLFVERVRLIEGFVSDEDLDELLDGAELAVFPYVRFASQSGAACRAVGRGCPVLVSDVGALPELAIGPDWIVPPEDVERLTRALIDRLKWVGQSDCRAAQFQRVKSLEWQAVARTHAALYRSLGPLV